MTTTALFLILMFPIEIRFESEVKPFLKAHQGKVTLAWKHLKTGESYFFQADEVMPTASLIKMSVMCEYHARLKEGKIKPGDLVTLRQEDKVPGAGVLTDCFTAGIRFPIEDAVRLMMTLSDNTATNLVIDQLGIKEINERMIRWGFPHTVLHAKVYRGSTTSIDPILTKQYGLGSTTAREMVDLLSKLHNGEIVSPQASKEMLTLMRLCHDDSMFRRFLNENQVIAHKTGATNAVRTSAGILQTETGPVALCVLTSENVDHSWLPDNAGQVLIARIAQKVMDYHRKK